MIVHICMTRQGRKNAPFFRIVAKDRRFRSPINSVKLGYICPLTKTIHLDEEKTKEMLSKGAKFTKKLYFRIKKHFSFLEDKFIER